MTTAPPARLMSSSFHTTRWTRVCLAQSGSEDGRRALTELCDAYYEPVVAWLRCSLRDQDAARDTAHAFFAALLSGGSIQGADQQRGRFRSYLLGAVKHFAAHERDAARRLKRGGGAVLLPLEDEEAVSVADQRGLQPDEEFDRQWAVTVLARSMEALRQECVSAGKGAFFDLVRPLIGGQAVRGDLTALAGEAGLSPDALRLAVHRLKKRLRECVKTEVAGTLDNNAAVQEEMEALFAALGR